MPVALPSFDALAAKGEGVPEERRFIRAALVRADPLMRSLGRPNREQVTTVRDPPCQPARSSMIWPWLLGSTPAVGSSSRSTSGS